jgi:general secretion pathway protein G
MNGTGPRVVQWEARTPKTERYAMTSGSADRVAGDSPAPRRGLRGFTLIELMVVIVILGMLVALVGPKVWSVLGTGTKGAANAQMKSLTDAVNLYVLQSRALPNSLDDLTQPSKSTNEAIMDKIPLDPWDQPYQYRILDRTKKSFEIWSYGEDKNPDTDDDLHWPPKDQK